MNSQITKKTALIWIFYCLSAAQLKHITPEAAHSRIQTAIDQYREAQKKSGLESESEQKKKDKQ